MKRFNNWVGCFTAIILLAVLIPKDQKADRTFYYAYDSKVYINEIPNKLIIEFDAQAEEEYLKGAIPELGNVKTMKKLGGLKYKVEMSSLESAKALAKIENIKGKVTSHKVFKTADGYEMGLTDRFIVGLKQNTRRNALDSLNKVFQAEIIDDNGLFITLKVSEEDVIKVANSYYESGLFKYSHPDFFSELTRNQIIPNDEYFSKQFALHNTGQVFTDGHSGTADADIDAPEAWEMTTGSSSIIVAVLDDGLVSNHADLPNSRQVRLNGSNFGNGSANDPSPTGDMYHGTACAGVIAATQNNNQGISGVAPNVKIMPVRIFNSGGSGVSTSSTANAIKFAVDNGAHILSNSWGYGGVSNPNYLPAIVDAIEYANDGGVVVVFSAGNNSGYSQAANFPSNVNVPNVLTVGASDRYDEKSFYSPVDSDIDIVAPSHKAYSNQTAGETWEAWSLDLPGDAGKNYVKEADHVGVGALPTVFSYLPTSGTNYKDYTGRFGGTSYSAPLVAGVAALMLSLEPGLTPQEIFGMLISTTDKVGTNSYSSGRNNYMGYGRLNAARAVEAAYVYDTYFTGASSICTTSSVTYNIHQLPGGITVSWSTSPNLQIVSSTNSSVTVSRVVSNLNTQGYIRATFPNGYSKKYPIIVGKAEVEYITFENGIGETDYFCTSHAGNEYELFPKADATHQIRLRQYPSLSIVYTSSAGLMGDQGTLNYTPSTPGYYLFEVKRTNVCGVTDWFGTEVEFVNCAWFLSGRESKSYTVYPNPASDYFTIQAKDEVSKGGFSAQNNQRSTTESKERHFYKLYDKNLNLVLSGYVNGAEKLNTSRLEKGVYILKIEIGDTVESHQVIIGE